MTPGKHPRSGRQTAFYRLALTGTEWGPDDIPNDLYRPDLWALFRAEKRAVVGLTQIAAERLCDLHSAWGHALAVVVNRGDRPIGPTKPADLADAVTQCVAAYVRRSHPDAGTITAALVDHIHAQAAAERRLAESPD